MPDHQFTQRLQAFSRRLELWRAQVSDLPVKAPPPVHVELDTVSEELRAAEEELRQQNEELLATQSILEGERQRDLELFELAPDGYLVTDERGVIREVNRAAGRLLGVAPQFLTAKSFLKFIHPDDVAATRQQIHTLHHTHAEIHWTARIVPRALPSYFGTLAISAIVRGTGLQSRIAGIRWMLRDDSERARLEAQVRSLAEEIEDLRIKAHALSESDRARLLQEQAAREAAEAALRAKDKYLALISHELRNPLAPVLLALDRLLASKDVTDEQRETLAMMRRNLETERRLIEDMLDVTRIVHGKLELRREFFPLHQVLNDVVGGMRDLIASRRITLAVEYLDADPWIYGDPTRLRQVFWNLLHNAAKFTPPGGHISLRSTMVRHDTCGEQSVVEVRDSGMGIAPESLETIFVAFDQASSRFARAQGGLGLGLAIARSLVEAHEGKLEAQSDGIGKGATFRVRLPRAIQQQRKALPPPAAHNGAPLSICLVDDHADTLSALSKLLQQLGHHVKTASTVAQACALLSTQTFDLLISDLRLPDGSGCDLLSRLPGQRFRHAVALSGTGTPEEMDATRRAGFAQHLLKPVSIAEVHQLLAALSNGQ